MTPEILSQLTVDLYRAAGEYPSSEFQGQALKLVKQIVPFDYAVWGLFAIVDGKGIAHNMYPYNLSQEACVEALAIAPQQDIFSHRIMNQPDRSHTATLEELPPESAEFHQWLNKYDIGYALGTCTIQPDTGLMQSLALQRSQSGLAFSEAERLFKEKLMPHLVESQRQNHRLQIRREQEVAQLFAQGLTHKAIAVPLFISPKTVRNHLTRVYGKLKVSNKTELLRQLAESDGQPAIAHAHHSSHRPFPS